MQLLALTGLIRESAPCILSPSGRQKLICFSKKRNRRQARVAWECGRATNSIDELKFAEVHTVATETGLTVLLTLQQSRFDISSIDLCYLRLLGCVCVWMRVVPTL